MRGHHILTWLLFAVISGSVADDPPPMRMLHSKVWEEYQSLLQDKVVLKKEMDYEREQLGRETLDKLEKSEVKRLEYRFPDCFKTWMSMLRKEIEPLFIDEYPAPCDQLSKRVDTQMSVEIAQFGHVMDNLQTCKWTLPACTSQDELNTLLRQVKRMKDQWQNYTRTDYLQTWEEMTFCYNKVSIAVQKSLSRLSVHAKTCGTISYETFLDLIGLKPLSIEVLITSKVSSFNGPALPDSIRRGYEEQSEIMGTWNFVQILLRNALRHIRSNIDAITNSSISNINSFLTTFFRAHPVSADYRLCYLRQERVIINNFADYFKGQLQASCFNGLIDARNALTNLDQCGLPLLEERLSKIRNCWAHLDDCRAISTTLVKIKNSLREWINVTLETPMKDAEYCYSQAKRMICDDIEVSIHSLQRCQMTLRSDISEKINSPVHEYPPYVGYGDCSSAL